MIDTRDLVTELEEIEAEAENCEPLCPECGGDHLSPPEGPRIWKCLSCHFAFDTPDWKGGIEPDTERADEIRELFETLGSEAYDGMTMVTEDEFEAYAIETAESCYDIPGQWPFTCIDWKQAASDLATDYTSVEFDGVSYYVR